MNILWFFIFFTFGTWQYLFRFIEEYTSTNIFFSLNSQEQAKSQKKKKVKATIKVDKADDLGLVDEATASNYYDDDDDFI